MSARRQAGTPALLAALLVAQLVVLSVATPGRVSGFSLNCSEPYVCFTLTITSTGDGIGLIGSADGHIYCGVYAGQTDPTGCSWKYRTLLTSPTVDVDLWAVSAFGNRVCFVSKSDGAPYRAAPVPVSGDCSSYVTEPVSGYAVVADLSIRLIATATVEYEFDALHTWIGVSATGTGIGTVTSKPAGINCTILSPTRVTPGSTCAAKFTYDQSLSLTATPRAGSVFHGWTAFCAGQKATCSTTVSKADNQGSIAGVRFDRIAPTGAPPTHTPVQSPGATGTESMPTPSTSTPAATATLGPDGTPSPSTSGAVAPAVVTAATDLAPVGIGIAIAGLLIALAIVGFGLASRRSRGRSGQGDAR